MRRVATIAALALLLACESRIRGLGCHNDEDCVKDGLAQAVCMDGVCVGPCSAESPCPSGRLCQEGRCVAAADGGQRCQRHEDCGRCEACSAAGICVAQAAGDDLKDDCAQEGCQTGVCDGAGACAIAAAGTLCRPAAGDCDVVELCTGQGPDCPADVLAPAMTVCRPAAGDCDLAEVCSGKEPICGADKKQPEGHQCGPASCRGSTFFPVRTCDGAGLCKSPAAVDCAPYVCGESACKTSCGANSDCTTGVCDLRTGTCAAAVTSVDCGGMPGALQQAIDSCIAGKTCYLRARGSCGKLSIQDRLVYVDGEHALTIAPSGPGAGVTIFENGAVQDQVTSVALVGLTIQGASGVAGHGVDCLGMSGGKPDVFLREVTIGGPGAAGLPNSGAGINASNSTVTVFASTVQKNSGDGISGSNSTLTVSASTVQSNSAAGINGLSSTVTVFASTVQNNSGAGVVLSNAGCGACQIRIERTRVISNVAGGLSLTQTSFVASNNIVADNGTSSQAAFGGVRISEPGATTSFVHNTVVGNGLSRKNGIECAFGVVPIVNSLVWGNGPGGGADEVVGCGTTMTGSHIKGGTAQACGTGVAPSLTSDYHLMPGSACVDKAPECGGLTVDVDGDPRPQPVGGRCDVGADEVK